MGTTEVADVAFGRGGMATADFLVRAHSLGVTSNGVNAAAAFPQMARLPGRRSKPAGAEDRSEARPVR
jgi:hypothetical protein